MKVAPLLGAAVVIYLVIPGSNQEKGKPKFCEGEDGNRYKKGEIYEDKENCIRYTCTKIQNKLKMEKENIIPCTGDISTIVEIFQKTKRTITDTNLNTVINFNVHNGMGSDCYSKYSKIYPYPAAKGKSLSECQTICTNNPECGAILMLKASIESGGSTSCYMVKPNNLFNEGTCTWGSGTYNAYEKKFTVFIYKVYKAMESSCYSKYTKISPYPAASSKSLSECQTICSDEPECGAIVMLKSSVESGGTTSCYMIKPNNLFNQGTCTWGNGNYNAYEKKVTGCVKDDNIDYHGNDIPDKNEIVNGLEGCIKWCGDTTACKYWTFAKSNQRCWLKTSDSDKREKSDRISGTKNCETVCAADAITEAACFCKGSTGGAGEPCTPGQKCNGDGTCQDESEPDLAANVTAIEASMQFLNDSLESIERKFEALQNSMQFLNDSMESIERKFEALQNSMESILEVIKATQSTSKNLESCLADISSSECPSPASGKTSVAALDDKCDATTCSFIQETVQELQQKFTLGYLVSARASSQLESNNYCFEEVIGSIQCIWGPQFAIDGLIQTTYGNIFHSNTEDYPWFEVELRYSTKISSVTIHNRPEAYGERFKNAEIRAGMTRVPDGTIGQLLNINTICGTYGGPGANGEEMRIDCTSPIMAKFITVQLKDINSVLQINEIRININGSIEQLVAKITQLEDALANTQGTVAEMESCLADSSSADCPPPASGKTSMAGRISANAAALADKCDASTCSNIQEEIAKFHPKRLNLVLIGGLDKFAGNSSEVISPTGVCKSTIPPLPFAAYEMEAVYFDNQIMLCGGHTKSTNTLRKSCHFLRTSASQWEEGPEMNVERSNFELVKAKDAVFAIGGSLFNNNGAIERTIEKYYGGKWTLLNQMPTERFSSCAIYWEAIDSLVVIGGFGTDKVEAFNIQLEQWSDLPSLPYELRLHNCALLNETIYVIAGAYHSGEHGDRTVLKYTMGAKAWEKSKPINSIRYYHSASVLDGKLLIAGSYNIHDMKKQIERMKDDETWEYMPWILSSERDRHADVEVPEQSFPCL